MHWLLLAGVVAALAWWVVALVQDKADDLPEVAGFPLPPVVAVGCLVLGLVLAVVGRMMVGGLARSRAEEAEADLRAVVHGVLDAEVVQPLRAEVTSYAAFRRGMDRARG